MHLLLSILLVLVNYVFSQTIPDVFLTGEPRVVQRRVLRVDLNTARQLSLPDDHQHVRVNIVDHPQNISKDCPHTTRTPATIYRRILKPARIIIVDGVETYEETGESFVVETWTLKRRPQIDGTVIHTQTQKRF